MGNKVKLVMFFVVNCLVLSSFFTGVVVGRKNYVPIIHVEQCEAEKVEQLKESEEYKEKFVQCVLVIRSLVKQGVIK